MAVSILLKEYVVTTLNAAVIKSFIFSLVSGGFQGSGWFDDKEKAKTQWRMEGVGLVNEVKVGCVWQQLNH